MADVRITGKKSLLARLKKQVAQLPSAKIVALLETVSEEMDGHFSKSSQQTKINWEQVEANSSFFGGLH